MIDFRTTTIKELHELLKRGEISVRDLFNTSLSRIKEKDDEIHAFLEVFEEQELPSFNEASLLSGIPFATKDNILFNGLRAGAASKILEPYRATYDAKVAEILKGAGAFPVGRVNMDEMAMGTSTENSAYGPTKNPHDTSRVPGGSSGGSAAAVAAGMVPFALGSDTGGSIRQPAALCGVVGLKPTYGSVSRRGLMAMASSLDVIGPITNSVEDAEFIFSILSEEDNLDQTNVPYSVREHYRKNEYGKRIGIPRAFLEREGIQKEILENFYATLEKLKGEGYEIVDVELPSFEYALATYYILQPAEVSSNMARYDGIRYGLSVDGETLRNVYEKTREEGFGKEVKRRIMLGTYVLSAGYHDAYYYRALETRKWIRAELREVFSRVDLIASPTAPSLPFKFGEKQDPLSLYLEDIFTVPYNLAGNPAISVPSGTSKEGLPFAIHFAAPLFSEHILFEAGKGVERVRGEMPLA